MKEVLIEVVKKEYGFTNFEQWSGHLYDQEFIRFVGWEDCEESESRRWNNNFYRNVNTGKFYDDND